MLTGDCGRYGPSELIATGNLKNWTALNVMKNIGVSTLLINGRYDEVTDLAVKPFFEHLSKVKWHVLENSSHMGHFEEKERYMKILYNFLEGDT